MMRLTSKSTSTLPQIIRLNVGLYAGMTQLVERTGLKILVLWVRVPLPALLTIWSKHEDIQENREDYSLVWNLPRFQERTSMSRTIRRKSEPKRRTKHWFDPNNLYWIYQRPCRANLWCSTFREMDERERTAAKAKYHSDSFTVEKPRFAADENRVYRRKAEFELSRFTRDCDHEVMIDRLIKDRTWWYY